MKDHTYDPGFHRDFAHASRRWGWAKPVWALLETEADRIARRLIEQAFGTPAPAPMQEPEQEPKGSEADDAD